MVQINEDQQDCAQVLLKRIDEYRVSRIGLVQQLEELDAQAGVVQRELNALHNSFAPIACLPEEVLAMVFQAGAHLKPETGIQFAVLVCHVTRSWRNIALATSPLWATIRCNKPEDMEYQPYPETRLERTATFLARSRSSPVEIYIHNCVTAEDVQFLQSIGNHSRRCQHLSIMGLYPEALPAALTHFSHQSVPLLESFELGLAGGRTFKLKEPLFPFGAPRVTTAQIGMLDFTTFHFCLPAFQSVTSLRLAPIRIDNDGHDDAYTSLREALMALPSLTHLELQDYYVTSNPHRLPIVLPGLQVLHASSADMYGFLHFLGPCIHGPSLTTLALQGDQGDRPMGQVPQVYFPSLRHLILLDVTRKVPGFGILSQFPSIQRLTCQAATASSQSFQVGIADIIAALGPGSLERGDTEHQMPCPQLHTIAVSAAYRPLDVVALTTQLSTLQDNGIPIRKLMLPKFLFAQAGVDLEVMAELRAVVEITDFRVDWSTPFASERFTEL